MCKVNRSIKPTDSQVKSDSMEVGTFEARLMPFVYNPKKLGFLDLPAEIRVMIYPDVFTSLRYLQAPYGQLNAHPNDEPGPSYAVPHTSVRYEGNPYNKLHGLPPLKLTRYGSKAWEDALYPQILATCQTINKEASLEWEKAYYRETAFEFHLYSTGDVLNIDKLQWYCDGIHNRCYADDYKREHGVRDLVRSSVLAAFLATVGRAKAAQISHLILRAEDCDIVTQNLPLVTELVKLHLPNLRQLDLEVYELEVHWDMSPDYCHPDRRSPFWENGDFEPMYRALRRFMEQVTWLRRFGYEGQSDFGWYNNYVESGWSRLKMLETKVWERGMREETMDEVAVTDKHGNDAPGSDEDIGDETSASKEPDSSGSEHDIEDLLAITGSIDFL